MQIRCLCPACGVSLMLEDAPPRMVKCPKCFGLAPLADYRKKPEKKVYCPNCDASITLKSDKVLKTITCPKCKRTELFAKFTDTPPEKDSGCGETETSTQLGGLNDPNAMYRPGKLSLLDGSPDPDIPAGTRFELKRGVNTLGRRSPKSSASIQFPTADPFMSKNHARIEVTMKRDATFEHCLSDAGSVNGTFHNGQRLEPGDISILITGDKIRLGHTTFVFLGSNILIL